MTTATRAASLFVTLRQAFIRLMLALATIVLIDACSKPPPPPPKPATEVTTLNITPRDTPVTMEFVAQTESADQVNIQARVSGFLDKTLYVEGELVKKGQVLFLMDQNHSRYSLMPLWPHWPDNRPQCRWLAPIWRVSNRFPS